MNKKIQDQKLVQKIMCSATLTLSSQWKEYRFKEKKNIKDDEQVTVDKLMNMIQFTNYSIVDLTTENKMAHTLIESQISCTYDDKLLYLYYFLFNFHEKTIIFANSISAVKRIYSILKILNFKVILFYK
jgi:superfamily II DNA/RNA helicase